MKVNARLSKAPNSSSKRLLVVSRVCGTEAWRNHLEGVRVTSRGPVVELGLRHRDLRRIGEAFGVSTKLAWDPGFESLRARHNFII